jgi:hypothetical protein
MNIKKCIDKDFDGKVRPLEELSEEQKQFYRQVWLTETFKQRKLRDGLWEERRKSQ